MKKMNFILSAMLVAQAAIWTTTSLASEPNWYARGLQAESSGNSTLAIQEYKNAAANGLSDAKFALGRLYRDVYGDLDESFKWFMEAATQGNPHAQYEVGLLYLKGTPAIQASREKAKKWFISAVHKTNHGQAAYELSKLSSTNEEKLKWLTLAAEQGVVEAMQALGDSYNNGAYGLVVDQNKGRVWLERAQQAQE